MVSGGSFLHICLFRSCRSEGYTTEEAALVGSIQAGLLLHLPPLPGGHGER